MLRFKFASFALLLSFGMCFGESIGFAQEDLTTDLVLHYNFEDRSEGTVPNAAGKNHVGRIHSSTFASRGGNDSLFLRQNDIPTGYVETADHEDFNRTAFTVAAWIKTRRDDSCGSVVCKHDWPNGLSRGFVLRCYSSRNVDFTLGAGGWVEAVGTTPIPANKWVHVAAQFDGDKICVFFNGRLEGSTPIISPYTPSPLPLRIGHAAFALEEKRKFDGSIDDVMIWKRALSEDEMLAVYEQQKKDRPRPLAAADVALLVKQLGDESFQVRNEAQRELIALDTEVLPLLNPHRSSSDLEVVWRLQVIEKEINKDKKQ